MPERKKARNHNELVLLEVLENAHQLLQGAPQRRPTTRLCLASAATLLIASQTHSESPNLAAGQQMTIEANSKMIELTDLEIQQLKEQNHRRIKRVVTVVAVTLFLMSFILVALSLSLGPKIDQLVSENLETNLSSKDLFLGPKKNETAIWR